MKRHERRGTIIVLALIALLLAATWAMRRCGTPDVPTPAVELLQFEAEADSSTITVSKSSRPPKQHSKKRRAKSPKKPKPSPEPRRVDPVPRF